MSSARRTALGSGSCSQSCGSGAAGRACRSVHRASSPARESSSGTNTADLGVGRGMNCLQIK